MGANARVDCPRGTSKNLAPAASTRCVAPSGAWLFVIHTSLILGRILRFSILPLSRLVRTKNTHACHPFEVLRSTPRCFKLSLNPAKLPDNTCKPLHLCITVLFNRVILSAPTIIPDAGEYPTSSPRRPVAPFVAQITTEVRMTYFGT